MAVHGGAPAIAPGPGLALLAVAGGPEEKQRAGLTWAVVVALLPMCAAQFLDAADGVYFNGIFRALEVDLGLDLADLGAMQVASGLAGIIFAPLWAAVVDQGLLSRGSLLAVSSAGWGLVSVLIGLFARGFRTLLVLRFLNNMFLCSLLPITQSFIARAAPPELVGTCFSVVQISGGIACVLMSQVSTAISEQIVVGMAGWRVGLLAIGSVSLCFAAVICTVLTEPPQQEKVQASAIFCNPTVVLLNLRDHLKILSFRVICLQGCCGLFASQVLQFATLYFQFCGLSDMQAGRIASFGHMGGIIGALVGGHAADQLARWDPRHGRQYLAQCSVATSIPILLGIFYFLSPGPESFVPLLVLMLLLYVSIGMVVPGVNKPILAQVAPKKHIASIMSWEVAMEASFGTTMGPTLVAWLSAKAGYHSSHVSISEISPAQRRQNASALAFVILSLTCSAFSLVVVGYTYLHWTYGQDLERLAKEAASAAGLKEDAELLQAPAAKESGPPGACREPSV